MENLPFATTLYFPGWMLIISLLSQPPTRQVCDKLFEAADKDNSGGIDHNEFVKIMGVCCAQILSRMVVYYLVLILLVPALAARFVDRLKIENSVSGFEML